MDAVAPILNRLTPLQSRKGVRVLAFYVYVALVVVYGTWRVSATLLRQGGLLPTAFELFYAILEAALIAGSLRTMSLVRDRIDRHEEADHSADWWMAGGSSAIPLIDVLIPTYNEPERVLEKSIAGAKQQRYGNYRIWVLDDGARANVRALAARMGVGYLAREQRTGAKAGNLNHAMSHIATLDRLPEFVAVVDSDYVLQPDFMRRSLALMKDSAVGLVQTPQFFWNPDPFQAAFPRGNPLPDDLRYTYDTLHPAMDDRGLAWCRGTSFIMRVATLHDIGGFAAETVVEDVLTTQRMRAKGWRTVYLDEALSFGLAAESMGEYLMQRHRWAMGFAQIGRMDWDNKAGRSLRKRFMGAEGRLRWPYTALVQALMTFVVPAAFWYLGLRPYQADARHMLLLGLPVWLFYRVYINWLSQGRNMALFREANFLAQVPALIGGAIRGLLRPHSHHFVVTSKGLRRDRIVVYWRTLVWTLAPVAVIAGGAVWRLGSGPGWADPAMILWTTYGVLVGALAAFMGVEQRNRRGEERFRGRSEQASVVLDGRAHAARIRDISCGGALLELPEAIAATGAEVSVSFGEAGPFDAFVARRPSPTLCALRFVAEGLQKERLICHVISMRFVSPVVTGSMLKASAAAVLRLAGGVRWVLRPLPRGSAEPRAAARSPAEAARPPV